MFFLGPWEKHHIAVPVPYFGKSDILRVWYGMKDTKCGSNLPHFQPEGGLWGGRLLLAQEDDFHSNGSFQVAKMASLERRTGMFYCPKGMYTVRVFKTNRRLLLPEVLPV